MRVSLVPSDPTLPLSDAPAQLVDGLQRLDEVERPRRASQVEPATFPEDASTVDLAWQPVAPATDGITVVARRVPVACEGPLAGCIDATFKCDIERLRACLSTLLTVPPLRWGTGAVEALVDEAYGSPLRQLWARAFAAAFNQLKLDGHVPLDVRAEHLTAEQCTLVSRAAHERCPRLAERSHALREALLEDVETLSRRLVCDLAALQAHLQARDAPTVVTRIVPLGDRHPSGWVAWVQLGDVTHSRTWDVVYKPRSLQVDQAFYDMAVALSTEDSPGIYVPWFLDRGAYGWMEFCAASDCTTPRDVDAFYERLGWLTALVSALEGRDCHAGNVVARGAFPVLVDLECLFSPVSDTFEEELRYPPITATALIPMTRFALGSFAGMDVSGFAGGQGGYHYYSRWWIDQTHAGALTLQRERRVLPPGTNVPRLNGRPVNPYAYCVHFVQGLQRAFSCLRAWGSRLLDHGPTSPETMETRVVFRNTSEYVKCLEEWNAPSAASSLEAEDTYFSASLRPVPGVDPADERDCLRKGVIPRHFVTHGAARRVQGAAPEEGQPHQAPISASGVERVRTLLDSALSAETVCGHVALIEHAFAAGARNAGAVFPLASEVDSSWTARDLLERVISSMDARTSHGHIPDWLTVTPSRRGALAPTRLHWGAFTGRAGIALAYAAAEASGVTSANASFEKLRRAAESNAVVVASSLPIEGLDGCAGVLMLSREAPPGQPRSSLQAALTARLQVSCGIGSFSPASAGTLIGLSAALEATPAPILADLARARVEAFVHSRELAGLIAGAGGSRRVAWASIWAMVLAAARAARQLGDARSLAALSSAIRGGELDAQTTQDRLFRLRLLLDAGSELDGHAMAHEIRELGSTVSMSTLGTQYGLGALLGIALDASQRGVIDDALADGIASAYTSGVHRWLSASASSALNRPLFPDAARGIAGVCLRLARLHAKKSSPCALVF